MLEFFKRITPMHCLDERNLWSVHKSEFYKVEIKGLIINGKNGSSLHLLNFVKIFYSF